MCSYSKVLECLTTKKWLKYLLNCRKLSLPAAVACVHWKEINNVKHPIWSFRLLFDVSFCCFFRVASIWWGITFCVYYNLSIIPGTTYVASLYWFPRIWYVVFAKSYGNPFSPCWQRNWRIFVSLQIKALHRQYKTLHGQTYYKQGYCKDVQIYAIFSNHDG